MDHQRYIRPAMFGIAGVAVLAALGLPVGSFLPFLLFLACPLMMVFMMAGMHHAHGSHRGYGAHESHQYGDQSEEVSAGRDLR